MWSEERGTSASGNMDAGSILGSRSHATDGQVFTRGEISAGLYSDGNETHPTRHV